MILRHAAETLERLALGFPLVLITGPRQSGKTTLARSSFPGKPYASLENPETRVLPRGYWASAMRLPSRYTPHAAHCSKR
jgi:hypothetical protein